MASTFDRWEKDPFFSVAEEVQQSADRMESTYRTWIHAIKDVSSTCNLKEIGRDLRTAISTTKWQLEEFEMAVQLSSLSEEGRDRHCDFIAAIKDQLLSIEKYLQESACSEVRSSMHLDEGEHNEPRRAPSSGSLSSRESAATVKWSKNSFKKANAELLRLFELPRGNDKCYEKNSAGVDCDDKQLNGWYGSIQRRLRRSMKNNSRFNITVWALMFICLIVLIVLHNI